MDRVFRWMDGCITFEWMNEVFVLMGGVYG